MRAGLGLGHYAAAAAAARELVWGAGVGRATGHVRMEQRAQPRLVDSKSSVVQRRRRKAKRLLPAAATGSSSGAAPRAAGCPARAKKSAKIPAHRWSPMRGPR